MTDVVKLAFGIAIGLILSKVLETGLGLGVFYLASKGFI